MFSKDNDQKILLIVKKLNVLYPEIQTELKYHSPFKLLISTILSAQCTDKRVNEVTKTLFRKYKSPADFAGANIKELQNEIRSTGFFRSKARYIKSSSRIILEKFNGKVPGNMPDLVSLPGVARKTANIVLSFAFGKNEGIAVDTHVMRLSKRLGLTANTDPKKIEKDLMQITPKKYWGRVNSLLVFHGRAICNARNPKCGKCILNEICPSAFSF